jgi:hypothetical protein
MSNKKVVARSATVVAASFVIAMCSLASGCGSSTKVEARTTTTGQELQDLEDARNKGLLTEDEYNKKRAEIMKRK